MRTTNAVARKRRHKKVLKAAKGYRGSRHRLYITAKETLLKAGQYAFRDRRAKKRAFRSLWIVRINAATRAAGMSYSQFMAGLRKAGVEIDRRQLSELAISDPGAFTTLVETARRAG